MLEFPTGSRWRRLADALGVPVVAVNDAQAAAWGEYRHGAGQGRDLLFLTVSSGIGGGMVAGGRLLHGARGLAGSLGQIPGRRGGPAGRARLGLRHRGGARGRRDTMDARACSRRRAGGGLGRARARRSAAALAAALVGLQALLDPERVVIGGGVGLAEGYLDRVRTALSRHPERLRPALVAARLGADAGVVGVADLAGS